MAQLEPNKQIYLPDGRRVDVYEKVFDGLGLSAGAQSAWSSDPSVKGGRFRCRGARAVFCQSESTTNPGAGLVIDFGFFPRTDSPDGDRKSNPTTDMRMSKVDGPNNWIPKGILHKMVCTDVTAAVGVSQAQVIVAEECDIRVNNGGAGTLTAARVDVFVIF